MSKKRTRRNRKKRIIAYIARTICAAVLILMLILMGCGCLYIYEHLNPKESEESSKTDDAGKNSNDTSNDEESKNDESNNHESNNHSVDASTKPLTPYTKPDASNLTIVLDAGHGGDDGGAVGYIGTTEVAEAHINLSVVLKMQALLEDAGATVILTRNSDTTLGLSDRNYISNGTGADLFVSIHCNSYEDDSISGLECFYHQKSETSQAYAERMVTMINRIGNVEARYSMPQNYQVLRDSAIPAILVEIGYMSNPVDCKNLQDPLYQDTMAETLVMAIADVLKNE